jgi:hypothetical protein
LADLVSKQETPGKNKSDDESQSRLQGSARIEKQQLDNDEPQQQGILIAETPEAPSGRTEEKYQKNKPVQQAEQPEGYDLHPIIPL